MIHVFTSFLNFWKRPELHYRRLCHLGTRSIKTWQVHWRIEGEELQSRERDRVHFFHAVFITSPSALMPLVLVAWKPRLTWRCILDLTPTKGGQFSNISISWWILFSKWRIVVNQKNEAVTKTGYSRRFYLHPKTYMALSQDFFQNWPPVVGFFTSREAAGLRLA